MESYCLTVCGKCLSVNDWISLLPLDTKILYLCWAWMRKGLGTSLLGLCKNLYEEITLANGQYMKWLLRTTLMRFSRGLSGVRRLKWSTIEVECDLIGLKIRITRSACWSELGVLELKGRWQRERWWCDTCRRYFIGDLFIGLDGSGTLRRAHARRLYGREKWRGKNLFLEELISKGWSGRKYVFKR